MLTGAASCTISARPSTTRWPRPGSGATDLPAGQDGAEQVTVDVDVGLEQHAEPRPAHGRAPVAVEERSDVRAPGGDDVEAGTDRLDEGGEGAVVVDPLGVVDEHHGGAPAVVEHGQGGETDGIGDEQLGAARTKGDGRSARATTQEIRVGGPQLLGQQDERARSAGPAAPTDEDVVAGVQDECRRGEVGVGDPDRGRSRDRYRARHAGKSTAATVAGSTPSGLGPPSAGHRAASAAHRIGHASPRARPPEARARSRPSTARPGGTRRPVGQAERPPADGCRPVTPPAARPGVRSWRPTWTPTAAPSTMTRSRASSTTKPLGSSKVDRSASQAVDEHDDLRPVARRRGADRPRRATGAPDGQPFAVRRRGAPRRSAAARRAAPARRRPCRRRRGGSSLGGVLGRQAEGDRLQRAGGAAPADPDAQQVAVRSGSR